MAQPASVYDTVLYAPKNLHVDQNIVVNLLDGAQIDIWGQLFVNGQPLATIGMIPIASQAEAEAGSDNTKAMTPLRTEQHLAAKGVLKTGGTFSGDISVPDEAWGPGWNSSLEVPTKNAVYDKTYAMDQTTNQKMDIIGGTFSGDIQVPDEIYGAAWDGSLEVPTKNALYDKIQTLGAGGGGLDQATADTRYVNITGDTGIGTLTLGSGSHINLSGIGSLITGGSGGVSAGFVTSVGAVDAQTTLHVAGTATFDSPVVAASVPSLGNHLTNRTYVDAQIAGVSAGGVTDGDKGDVVVSASGATWMLDSSVVTAAAKTVLDDSTTAAMLITLGGVSNSAVIDTAHGGTGKTDWGTKRVVLSGDTASTDPLRNMLAGTAGYALVSGGSGVDPSWTNLSTLYQAKSRTVNGYSGTSLTAVIGDAGAYVRCTGSNPTYTIPPNSSVAFPVGTQIDGVGTATAMTLIQGSGVTLNKPRTLVTVAADSGWTVIKVGTDEWDVHGDFV